MTLREKALALPMKPGVYIMRDKDGTVIYVGKAKLLRNRVSSYFHGAHNAKTEAMIAKIADFSVIIADSEFEALVLENSLIKHHAPHYNILLKDDKGYPFIRVDLKNPYPRMSVASKREEDGAEYFGPFGARGSTFAAIDAIQKALKLPDCSRKFPRDIGKERPCLNYHMGTCSGYCLPEVNKQQYDEAMEKAVLILKGRGRELTDKLRQEMEELAAQLKFEEAAARRDMLNAVTALETRQHVLMKGSADTDAVGFFRGEAKSCFNVLHYVRGQLLGKDTEMVDDSGYEDTAEAMSSLVRQYYGARGTAPREVILTEDTGDTGELEKYLTELAGRPVSVLLPQRGIKRDYQEAALRNAREETERLTTREDRISATAAWLRDNLGLERAPGRIESFDISNTGSSDIVASMVVFKDGKPQKSAYRKFRIKTLEGAPDDYASMREVVTRRLQRFADGDEKFAPLPDLMLIDGGAAHAACALEAMDKVGVRCPVYGMVKDDRHRTRALITAKGEEIGISHLPSVFAYVGRIQEEVHRFAITFHRESHLKSTKRSVLDCVPGIGEKRKEDLFKAFRSLKNMESATVEELCRVVPRNAAQALYERFHGTEGEETQ